jgi:hypothetical protein
LKASAIAGVTALAFYEVGSVTQANASTIGPDAARLENIAGHALVGCGSSVASGGSCGSGALSAGVSAAAGPLINDPYSVKSLVANAVLGG